MSCDCPCSVALPHGTVGWSAVCDCGISWLYSLFFEWDDESEETVNWHMR